MDTPAPLILTCRLNPEAYDFFNALRAEHFPPDRNFIQAHLTLFHHLPAGEPDILTAIRDLSTRYAPFTLPVTGVVFTGKGVSYKIESRQLKELHGSLQQRWKAWLIPQDRQGLWPHITIQNKVEPWKARLLQQELEAGFKPFDITASGLNLWEYLGGPWRFLDSFQFEGTG